MNYEKMPKRKIKGETFNNEVTPPKAENVPDYERPDFTPKKKPMKKVFRAITNTLAGKNKTGEALHGILDILPISNQPIAKAIAFLQEGDEVKAEEEFKKLLTFRNLIAFIAFILVATGVVSVQDVKDALNLFSGM